MAAAATSLEDFVERTRRLLAQEHEEQRRQNDHLLSGRPLRELQHLGVALLKVHLVEGRAAAGRRHMLKFARKPFDPSPPFGEHKLTPGDTVCITHSSGTVLAPESVVSSVSDTSISLSIRAAPQSDSAHKDGDLDPMRQWAPASTTFNLVQTVNLVTQRRMEKALDLLAASTENDIAQFLFHASSPRNIVAIPFHENSMESARGALDVKLNESQLAAVSFCTDANAPLVTCVHGPPGTGKTRTLGLGLPPGRLVRLGHPCRTHTSNRPLTLDSLIERSDLKAVVDQLRVDLAESRRGGRSTRQQTRHLQSELKRRENDSLRTVLMHCLGLLPRWHYKQALCTTQARVIAGTLTTVCMDDYPLKVLPRAHRFHWTIVDECGQAIELACWPALLQSRRAILAGDHNQLPPTVISDHAAASGLSTSLMQRIAAEHSAKQLMRLLDVQYRMHADIMSWSSARFYEGRLFAAEAVAGHLLSDLPTWSPPPTVDCADANIAWWGALCTIDTDGCAMGELLAGDGAGVEESRANPGEVYLVYLHVRCLLQCGVPPESIALISPYSAQVQLLRVHVGGALGDGKLSVRTIDGFQGQERDCVVLSMVRSNVQRNIGFVREWRRLNVAVTRARRHLCVIGDRDTLRTDAVCASLFEHIESRGCVQSALEFQDMLTEVPFEIDTSDMSEAPVQSAPVGRGVNSTASPSKPTSAAKKKPPPKLQPSKSNDNQQTSVITSIHGKSTPKSSELVDVEPQWQIELQQSIQSFASDPSQTKLELSETLDAYGRRLAHELAAQLDLQHVSVGQGGGRRLVISKTTVSNYSDGIVSDNNLEPTGGLVSEEMASEAMQECKIDPIPVQQQRKPEKCKPKSKKTAIEVPDTAITELDDDSFLDAAVAAANKCSYPKCKASVALWAQICRHCKLAHCNKHAQYEVHGCGDVAKTVARAEFKASMRDDIAGVKKTSEREKAHAQAKLKDKLQQLNAQRKGQTKK